MHQTANITHTKQQKMNLKISQPIQFRTPKPKQQTKTTKHLLKIQDQHSSLPSKSTTQQPPTQKSTTPFCHHKLPRNSVIHSTKQNNKLTSNSKENNRELTSITKTTTTQKSTPNGLTSTVNQHTQKTQIKPHQHNHNPIPKHYKNFSIRL